jgi:hypothetical protein
MRPAKTRYKLWHIMLAIAILAGLFAWIEPPAVVGMLIAISVVFLPIVMASPARRLGVAAWVCSLYPLLLLSSLYATWFTAWCILGYRPRETLDDPKYISPLVDVPFISTGMLMLGLPFTLLLCVPLMLAHIAQIVSQRRIRPREGAAQLLIPLILWLSFIVISRWEPFGVSYLIGWYID